MKRSAFAAAFAAAAVLLPATAVAKSNPITAALAKAGEAQVVTVDFSGPCLADAGEIARCSWTAASDKQAGYVYLEMKDSGLAIVGNATGSFYKVDGCWTSAGGPVEEAEVTPLDTAALVKALKGYKIVKKGRTITATKGKERGTFKIDGAGRLVSAAISEKRGKTSMKFSYPATIAQVVPEPLCPQ